MAIQRVFMICIYLTVVAVGYVHQKVEITKAGYCLQESKKCLAEQIDQNSRLLYNLAKLESPKNLLAAVDAEKVKFANQRVVVCNNGVADRIESGKSGSNNGLVSRFMDLFMSSAEAKSHN
ncbi:MAG TPA: hypothetical protein PKY78_03435 [Candidatus Omnitrophota bacterium]|nr:hypothetical protein [Candidatus Omnitrophota bacterium]HPS20027.1 hypothetical protein [Candidatus Omnitrophota bacterium]